MIERKKNKFADSKVGAAKPALNYVDNEKFYAACLVHYDTRLENAKHNLPPPRVSEYIGSCLLNIAHKLATSRHFNRYPFIENMTMDAVENCLKYFNNFDPITYKNPFSYFSQICYYAFLRCIDQERDNIYNQFKMSEQARFELTGHVENVYDDNYDTVMNNVSDERTDAMYDFVKKYEHAKVEKKKKASKAAKVVKAKKGSAKLDFEEDT